MINNLQILLTYENIYLFANWGVLPFWILLILAPTHTATKVINQSIIAPLLFSSAYIFLAYEIYINENFLEGFNLYLGLENLYTLFSDEAFLLIFWLHFLSISLFTGCWISRESEKYNIPRVLSILSLLLTYFTGPIGLLVFWFFRIFFTFYISFNE